jgi:hypothetical protein
MPTVSETGHAINVAHFQDVIDFVIGYGATYNPTKTVLKLASLTTKMATETTNLSAVTTENTAFNDAVNDRAIEFSDIRPLSTRILNALSATDASTQKIDDAKTYNRKIQGKRAKAVPTPTVPPNPTAPTTISASQQSFDQLVQHFDGLISVAGSEPSYAPNEVDLKIVTLTAKGATMLTLNNAVGTAFTGISNARITRNKGLYAVKTGLVDIAEGVKDYVKSIYGFKSPEYKQISKIKFTRA